jgi:HEAT repeat protein
LAIKVIPQFGPVAVLPATKGLIARANDEDTGVRVNALIALGAIGARTRDEAKPIIDALKLAINNTGPGSIVRLHATRAIANYGLLANDATGTLLGIAKDTSWETRRAVAAALGRCGQVQTPGAPNPKGTDPKPKAADMDKWSPNEKVLSTLRTMMGEDISAQVRLEAVQSLVILGPPEVPAEQYAEKVTPFYNAVNARLKNEKDKGVLVWLIMLQMRLNGADLNDDNVKKVAGYLADVSPSVKVHALTALALLGDKARPALNAIASLLLDPEDFVKVQTILTIAALGDTARPLVIDLTKLISDTKDEALKKLAQEAITVLNSPKKK